MKHRIRAAALIVENGRILLVRHDDPLTGKTYWVPPGGGLEAVDESIFDCARREAFEETGLTVSVSRIVYMREFREESRATLHLEVFLLADTATGTVTLEHLPAGQPDSEMITESRWVGREELGSLTVYPEELKGVFWDHLAAGFPQTIYLGRQAE